MWSRSDMGCFLGREFIFSPFRFVLAFRCRFIFVAPPAAPVFPFSPYSNFVWCRAMSSCIDSSHYPDNTHSYTDETYYWEIVLTARKVGIVAISVFGRVIGTQRQAQVALLILFLCISIEIAARPYKIATERHKVLGRLELATLFSLTVHWSPREHTLRRPAPSGRGEQGTG